MLSVDLRDNKIIRLRNYTFSRLTMCERLYLSNIGLNKIDKDAFSGLNNCKLLYFTSEPQQNKVSGSKSF